MPLGCRAVYRSLSLLYCLLTFYEEPIPELLSLKKLSAVKFLHIFVSLILRLCAFIYRMDSDCNLGFGT